MFFDCREAAAEPLLFHVLAHKNILIAVVAAALPDLLLLFSLHQPVFYDSPWPMRRVILATPTYRRETAAAKM